MWRWLSAIGLGIGAAIGLWDLAVRVWFGALLLPSSDPFPSIIVGVLIGAHVAVVVPFGALYHTRFVRLLNAALALAAGLLLANLTGGFFIENRMEGLLEIGNSDNHIADAMSLVLLPLVAIVWGVQLVGWNLLVVLATWLSFAAPFGATIALGSLSRAALRARTRAAARRRFEALTGERAVPYVPGESAIRQKVRLAHDTATLPER